MEPIKRILCAADFSSSSEAGFRYTLTLAEALDASVDLLHVIPYPVGVTADTAFPEWPEQIDRDVQEELDALVGRFDTGKVHVRTHHVMGRAHAEIVRAAQTLGVDLTVLGARGITGLKRVLLGSVTQRVLRTAHGPVLAIPHDYPPTLPQRILVAHDFSSASRRALETARLLRNQLKAEVHVVHVHEDPISGYSVLPKESLWGTPAEFEARMLERRSALEAVVSEHFPRSGPPVHAHVERGNPPSHILAVAEKVDAQLVCMGSTGKNAIERALFGSVAERVTKLSHAPVWTVH